MNLTELKLKSGCTSKVTTKKTKIQPAAWEKILVNYMANKGLIPQIHKPLIHLTITYNNSTSKNQAN